MPFTPGRPITEAKADLFKAMGHPGRLRVLELLVDGDRTIGELVSLTGLETSHLSQQVAALRRAGLIVSERTGSSVTCTLGDPQIAHLLRVAREMVANHLRNTHDLLAALDDTDRAAAGFAANDDKGRLADRRSGSD